MSAPESDVVQATLVRWLRKVEDSRLLETTPDTLLTAESMQYHSNARGWESMVSLARWYLLKDGKPTGDNRMGALRQAGFGICKTDRNWCIQTKNGKIPFATTN